MKNTINPYKTKYKIKIIKKIEKDNTTYGKLEYIPFFIGTERVKGDNFKINNKEVKFLEEDSNYIELDNPEINSVEVAIDFKNRLGIMQQNLANAIVRHYIKECTDLTIKNYKVSNKSSYVDVYGNDLKFTTLDNLESMANYALLSNLNVINNSNEIEIEKLAKISYFGPSLQRTGEVGMILLKSPERNDNLIRINIVAGESCYKFARNSINILKNIKMYLGSEKLEDIFSDIKKIKSGVEIKREEISQEKSQKSDEEKEELELPLTNSENPNYNTEEKINKKIQDKDTKSPKKSKNSENIKEQKSETYESELLEAVKYFRQYATEVSGINYIYKVLSDINLKELKEVSSHILKEENYIQIYGVKNTKNPHRSKVLVLRSQNLNFNLKEILEKLKEKFNFTGSGNIYMVELECEEKDATSIMENFLLEIKKKIDK